MAAPKRSRARPLAAEAGPAGASAPSLTPPAVWAARAAVVAAALATFARGVPNALVLSWDDGRFFVEEPETSTVSFSSLRSILTEPHFQAYHPLHLLSYWIDRPWAGPSGPVLHATNLALWCVALVVVLELLRALGLGLRAATLATLLFGLHPVQVEAVGWAVGRKEILAIGLSAGAALAHLRSERAHDRPAWICRGLYLLAALSKTTVLPLPLVLALADVTLRGKTPDEALRRQIPSLALGLGLGLVVVGIWRANAMIRGDGSDLGDTTLLVPGTLAHHLGTALWPARTSPLYPLAREEPIVAWQALLGTGALAAGLALGWWRRGTALGRRALFGLGSFLVLLLPVSNLIPVYFQWQDRYLCLPLLGLAFLAGALLEAARASKAVLMLGGAAVLALAARTVQYEGAWRDDTALWENAVGAQPRAFYAWIKLGEIRRDAADLEGALRAYRRAIEINPRLRLGYTAFFSVLLLRDVARHHAEPVPMASTTQRFMVHMDDPVPLRELAGDLEQAGYRQAVLFVLDRALAIAPIADERLEAAAVVQQRRGALWLARFYLSEMTREPFNPALRAHLAFEPLGDSGQDRPQAPPRTDDSTEALSTGPRRSVPR